MYSCLAHARETRAVPASTAADGVKDMELAGFQCGVEAFEAFDVVAADKDVDVLAYLALFVEDAVAKCGIDLPQRVESFTDSRKISIELRLSVTACVTF